MCDRHKQAWRKPCAFGVCMNAQISAIMKARDTKFGMKIPIYHRQLQFIANSRCHANRLCKSVISIEVPTFCFGMLHESEEAIGAKICVVTDYITKGILLSGLINCSLWYLAKVL